ncbi:MAG: hypothetical protein ACPLRR_08215 [Candidatus Saccharicenans sp.]
MKNKRATAFIKTGKGWRVVVLSAGLILLLVSAWSGARGEVKPQFGLEGYGGSNKLFILSPWVGFRIGLSHQASLIFRYHYHNFRYDYYGSDSGGGPVLKTMKADVSRLAGTVYFAGSRLSGYVNLSYLAGSDSYRGFLADSGLEYKFSHHLAGLWSVYSVREKSVLWHPEEEVRWINTYSMRFGMKFWLIKNLALNPNLYLMRNSEEVEGVSYSFGLIYSPKWWLAVHAYYFRYGETAFYVFHGNYFSCGLNFFF